MIRWPICFDSGVRGSLIMIQTPAQTEVTAAIESVVSEADQSAGTRHVSEIPATKYNALLLIDCYSQIN